jgi:hypothetical protein
MSAHRTTRRAMLAGAATVSATAAVATASALASASPAETSFPDLVAKFIRVRERWRAQQEVDETHRRMRAELFRKAVGFPFEEWRTLEDQTDPRFAQGQAIYDMIWEEEWDPVDEHGCSIAWNEIHDELCPLAEEVLSRTPQSLADLAWQAEILFVSEPELHDQTLMDDAEEEGPALHWTFIRNVRALGGLS